MNGRNPWYPFGLPGYPGGPPGFPTAGQMPGFPPPGGFMPNGYPVPQMPPQQPAPPPWSHAPFNEGDPRVPPAGWEQTPRSAADYERARSHNPTVRWGDVTTLNFPIGAPGPVVAPAPQFADFWLAMPAVCMVRLAAVDISNNAIVGTDLITWKLLIGVGNATSTKFYTTIPDPTDGSTNHDLILTLPLEHLTVEASASITNPGASPRVLQLAAQIAPFTSYPALVRAP